jgi:ribose transport system substrate-binding protein
MKWVYKVVFGLLTALTIASAAGSLYYYSRVNNSTDDETAYEFRSYPDYYFSLILNTQDDIYWEEFKDGATAAGKDYNAAIEFNEVFEPESQSQIVEYIHIANQSKMDGIIVAGESTEEYNAAIAEAHASGINVIVGFETSNDQVTYVGTNNYEFGLDAAKLISQTPNKDARVAVILSNQGSENVSSSSSMISGLSKGEVNLTRTLYRTSDLLGAEDQIRATLNENPNIDVIFCTNAKDTVSAAHVIIERNLVGKVAIVGTGVTSEIIDYIRKGVIFGVLDRKGYTAGYQSVKILCESMGGTFKSSYKVINTSTYTKDNIGSYVKP